MRRGAQRRRRRGDVRHGALLLLAEGPMNGYGILRELAERSGGTWRPSSGAVYPALSLLEDEGLIGPAEDAGPKHYQLTDAGRAELEHLADRPAPWDDATEEATSRLGGDAELWKAFGDAAMAVRAVVQTGDQAAGAAATEELVALRKRLYGLLADADG
ncbi:PadR family transcriptional regulator [Dietzia sp. UBA5065]|nr:PadR family transcriptional regulator [Dietzia sp. UBA5065]